MKQFSTPSFIIGIIVGALLAGAWFFRDNPDFIRLSSPGSDTTATGRSATSSGLLMVADQPAGSEVLVESVTVPPPGVWVAVREIVGSDLGNVLGAAKVGGPRTSVAVSLLRATEAGHTYAVELYRDDNEGAFDPAKNSVYVDFDSGTRVVTYFRTQ